MQEYFIELAKYIAAALMALYTVSALASFCGRIARTKLLYVAQSVLIFLLQAVIFANLALVSKNVEYLFFYAFVQVFLLALLIMTPVIYEKADRLLLNHMCLLTGVGFGILARLNIKKAERQYVIALVSLTVALFIPWILEKFRVWKRFTWLYGVLGIVLLSAVLIWGEVTHGSKITFSLYIAPIGKTFAFQPSEFVKIIYVFFLAAALRDRPRFPRVALTAAFAGLYVIILVVSKDLGGALIFFVSYVFIVFAATGNYLYLLAGAAGGSGAAYVAYQLFDHVKTRVLAWRDPWAYIDTKGYAITQSLFAIGSGSWFGMGLLKGNPRSIPFVEEDFIFSAICEEMGVVFGSCLVAVTVCCFLHLIKLSAQIRDKFYQLIVYGIGIIYIFQIFLTVGGGVKLIPLTGVTLPFVSYGGTSVTATIFMFFIVQGIYIRLQIETGRSGKGGSDSGRAKTERKRNSERIGEDDAEDDTEEDEESGELLGRDIRRNSGFSD